MKKIYTLTLIAFSVISMFGQAFTAPAYDFSGIVAVTVGTSTTTVQTNGTSDPTPVPIVAGVTFGSFTVVNPASPNTFTGSGAPGRLSYANQPLGAQNGNTVYSELTGAINTAIYYQVTVGPNAGGQIDLTTIGFVPRRSGTGVRTVAVRSSVDNYTANLPGVYSASPTSLSVQGGNVFYFLADAANLVIPGSVINLTAGHNNLTAPVTFRFYGFNAEGDAGNFGLDDVVFSGNIDNLSNGSFNQIAGLSIYPNPAKGGLLYIDTQANAEKNVAVFDVLGKQVLNVTTTSNNVNVSRLVDGVYIVKVTENGSTATRKLVINN